MLRSIEAAVFYARELRLLAGQPGSAAGRIGAARSVAGLVVDAVVGSRSMFGASWWSLFY